MPEQSSLAALGWRPYFQQQLKLEELDDCIPARIVEQHKSLITVATESSLINVELQSSMPTMVVGDWILLDSDWKFHRLLDRSTCFKRRAAGPGLDVQLISANVDTAFIVCSLNEDFNLNRIERYLSLVNESGAQAVVVLSKSDLCENAEEAKAEVQSLDSLLCVETVNCLDDESVNKLSPWLKQGETIAILGSSGVGKSTLVNTLLGSERMATAGIREDDSKGRHTTTARSLAPIPSGALMLDTPGMREIQLADSKEGISQTFSDIATLSEQCRFSDCQHISEPGCAVLLAVENGEIDQRRLDNYLKLLREEALNSASLSERRAKDKALGKFYKRTMVDSKKLKGREE